MNSRVPLIVALLLATFALGFAGSRLINSVPHPPPPAHASLPPALASYLGTFEPGAPSDYGAVASFARTANRKPNLVGYYSGWTQPFDTASARMLQAQGAVPFVQIDPTATSINGIANGTYDDYLRSYADSVRNFRHAVVIGFGHEMNASWYPWGYKRVPAATFVGAWRHIVTLFREEGAQNVTWLWTLQAVEPGTGPIASWWPGAQYVTWVGIDGFYYRPSDTFASVFGKTITQVRTFTNKPVLLSECAVGPAAGQFDKIHDLFQGMARYKTLGLVWFDKAQHGSIFHQDWRLADSLQAPPSFRLGVREELAPYHAIG
jgi:hypothetical protein